jgi:hypothetical protein
MIHGSQNPERKPENNSKEKIQDSSNHAGPADPEFDELFREGSVHCIPATKGAGAFAMDKMYEWLEGSTGICITGIQKVYSGLATLMFVCERLSRYFTTCGTVSCYSGRQGSLVHLSG